MEEINLPTAITRLRRGHILAASLSNNDMKGARRLLETNYQTFKNMKDYRYRVDRDPTKLKFAGSELSLKGNKYYQMHIKSIEVLIVKNGTTGALLIYKIRKVDL